MKFNILLSILVCAAAKLILCLGDECPCLRAIYAISGSTHELQTCLFMQAPMLPLEVYVAGLGECSCPAGRDSSLNLLVWVLVSDAASLSQI